MSRAVLLAVECRFDTRDAVPSQRLLRRWARAALGARGAGHEMALSTVGAARMRSLNRRYRGKDKPTNVLSFPAQPHPLAQGSGPAPLGDVVICPAVLRREAREQGKAERAHWAHLVVHGALHLAGYDHEVEADARRMERREIAVLRTLGFGNPYFLATARGARR
jgi:probable rRNA maturation factor